MRILPPSSLESEDLYGNRGGNTDEDEIHSVWQAKLTRPVPMPENQLAHEKHDRCEKCITQTCPETEDPRIQIGYRHALVEWHLGHLPYVIDAQSYSKYYAQS